MQNATGASLKAFYYVSYNFNVQFHHDQVELRAKARSVPSALQVIFNCAALQKFSTEGDIDFLAPNRIFRNNCDRCSGDLIPPHTKHIVVQQFG